MATAHNEAALALQWLSDVCFTLETAPVVQPCPPPRRRVRWGMITVHEFGVDLGASTVPSKGGPPIGLAHIPQTTTQVRVEDVEQSRSRTRRFSREDRVRMLQNAGIEDAIITRFARETNIILKSRKRAIETLEDSDDERDELEDKAAAPASHLCKRPRSPSAIQEQEEEREALALRRPRMIPTNYV